MTDKQVIIDEQEYSQLKADNDKYSLFIEKLCDYAGLECDSEEQAMRALSYLVSQVNKDRYKQTLAEIKEICNSVENIENINSLYDAKLSGMFLQANKILQKIKECEVENAKYV